MVSFFRKLINYLHVQSYIKLPDNFERKSVPWKPTTSCTSPTKGLTFRWSTKTRATCSNTLLRWSRTLLPRSAILAWWWLARDTYVGKLFSASVTHLPLAGFHLFVMGMIIPHDRASIVNRCNARESYKLDMRESRD